MIIGMQYLSYEDRRELGLFCLEKRRLQADTITAFHNNGGLQENWRTTFFRSCSDRTRDYVFKLKEGRFKVRY